MRVPQESAPDALLPSELKDEAPSKLCDNCGKRTIVTKKSKRFCSNQCRMEYHKYGAAFGPLKAKLVKVIKEETGAAIKPGLAKIVSAEDFIDLMRKAGFVHRSQLKRRPEELQPAAIVARIIRLGEQVSHANAVLSAEIRKVKQYARRRTSPAAKEATQGRSPKAAAPQPSTTKSARTESRGRRRSRA